MGGLNYVGQPGFYLTTFTGIGNNNGSNPFEFRDNQFTGDVNLSWLHGHHAVKVGYTYYHFDLNHFQPTSGGQPNVPRGGFFFQGGMTCGLLARRRRLPQHAPSTGTTRLLTSCSACPTMAPATRLETLRRSSIPTLCAGPKMAFMCRIPGRSIPKLTLTYGLRYEVYPAPYRDRTGASVLLPQLPQSTTGSTR